MVHPRVAGESFFLTGFIYFLVAIVVFVFMRKWHNVAVIPKPRNFFFAVLRKRQKTYYKTKFAFVLPIHNYNVYS